MPLRSTAVRLAFRLNLCAALACTAACASGPRRRPNSPEAILEAQLISRQHRPNKRTGDGGMLFYADFDGTSPETLRVPYDMLKLQCENRGGRWGAVAPPQSSAEALLKSNTDTPEPIRAALRDADQHGVFGRYGCESPEEVWMAEIEPSRFMRSDRGYRLELYLRATEEDMETSGGELPDSGGLPPVGSPPPSAAGQTLGSPPPPSAAGGDETASPPPPAATESAAPASPLSPQLPRPSLQGDKLLADPRPFGINMGTDSPEVLASKLKLDPTPTKCEQRPGKGLTNQCWQHPGNSEALFLQAQFADLGMGPVVAEVTLRYPPTAFVWLEQNLSNTLGPADTAEASEQTRSWSWLHTTIVLSHQGDDAQHETLVEIAHKPTLDRARLPRLPNGAPGREQLGPARIATPWQLQLGYEPAQLAQSKLQAAGFSISETGCTDGGAHARPVFTRTCPLRGGKMEGMRNAWVRIVDIGDGRPRLAELEYTFDKSALEETRKELQTQYGAPIASQGGIEQWWTGPVGIAITPTPDGFSLRYFHGRLLQYFIQAAAKSRVAEKALQHQGL